MISLMKPFAIIEYFPEEDVFYLIIGDEPIMLTFHISGKDSGKFYKALRSKRKVFILLCHGVELYLDEETRKIVAEEMKYALEQRNS